MTSVLFSQYQFIPIPDDLIEECKRNLNLTPIAYKSLGMGLVQVIATLNNDKTKYFLFDVGGPSAEDYEYNQRVMKQLTSKDSMTWTDLLNKLS